MDVLKIENSRHMHNNVITEYGVHTYIRMCETCTARMYICMYVRMYVVRKG